MSNISAVQIFDIIVLVIEKHELINWIEDFGPLYFQVFEDAIIAQQVRFLFQVVAVAKGTQSKKQFCRSLLFSWVLNSFESVLTFRLYNGFSWPLLAGINLFLLIWFRRFWALNNIAIYLFILILSRKWLWNSIESYVAGRRRVWYINGALKRYGTRALMILRISRQLWLLLSLDILAVYNPIWTNRICTLYNWPLNVWRNLLWVSNLHLRLHKPKFIVLVRVIWWGILGNQITRLIFLFLFDYISVPHWPNHWVILVKFDFLWLDFHILMLLERSKQLSLPLLDSVIDTVFVNKAHRFLHHFEAILIWNILSIFL